VVATQQRPAAPSRAEYERRTSALRTLIDDTGLDGVIVYGSSMRPGPLLYLSGYVPTNGFACLHLDSENETLLTDQPWDVAQARETLWLRREGILASDDIGSDVAPLVATSQRIGVIGWELLPAGVADQIRGAGAGIELVDIGGEAALLRIVKSDEEIALLREACRITSVGAAAFATNAVAGITERELAASVESTMRAAGSGSLAFPLVLGAGAHQTASAVPLPGDGVLTDGDMVLIDCGATFQGYCGDMARALVVGTASVDQRRLLESTHKIFNECEALLGPGVKGADVHRLATDVATAEGYTLPFLLGHGIGCQNWEPPFLSGEDVTELAPGMVITLEPGIYVPDVGGARLENTFLITETGAEALTSGPIDLWET
jgi:Xaa-Pro aminopeptidase